MKARVHLDRDLRFARINIRLSESNLRMLMGKVESAKKDVKTGRFNRNPGIVSGVNVKSPWEGTISLSVESDNQHYEGAEVEETVVEIYEPDGFKEEDNPCGC